MTRRSPKDARFLVGNFSFDVLLASALAH